MARNPDLEAKLIEHPDDTATLLVYADFLQSKGDPRGELISLSHAGKHAEATALLAAHEEHFYGPLKDYKTTFDGFSTPAFTWRNGFIRSARLAYDSNSADDVAVADGVKIDLAVALAELLRHPSGMLLEELVIPINMLDDGGYFGPLVAAIAEHGAPALRRVRIGEFTCAGGPGGSGDYEYEISWTTLGDASGLWKAVPRLEELVLQVGLGGTSCNREMERLGEIDAPNLRALEIITGGMNKDCVASLARATFPALEKMDLWFGSSDYGASGGTDDIARILIGTGLPKVRRLGLMNCEFVNDVCERIATSPILPQLEELSLAYGTMTDAGAEALLRRAAAVRHLRALDLRENYLTERTLAALTDLCGQVMTEGQREADDDDEVRRYVSLGE